MDKVCCQVCLTFVCSSVPLMFRHLNQVHRNDPGLHITCDIVGCQRSFKKVFKILIYTKEEFACQISVSIR